MPVCVRAVYVATKRLKQFKPPSTNLWIWNYAIGTEKKILIGL